MLLGLRSALVLAVVMAASACTQKPPEVQTLKTDEIAKILPSHVKDKMGWSADMAQVFDELSIAKTTQNICTAVAIIDQESNFNADPAVPNLGQSSLKALNDKLNDKLGKTAAAMFANMLANKPDPSNSFLKQIKQVKTEKQLDELYRQMFLYFGQQYKVGAINSTAKLLNLGIDEKLNPITTLGSMQAHIDYAKAHRRRSMSDDELRADLYSRYGGLYYGIHRLMLYPAQYAKPIYRFADYNSGMYSSRNASFQKAVATLSKQSLALDGDLLLYQDGAIKKQLSQTEQALLTLLPQLSAINANITQKSLRSDLKYEKSARFEQTQTYQAVAQLFEQKQGEPLPYAIMPKVVISSAKLSRDYDTNWFATNVNKRYERCIASAKQHGLIGKL